MIPSYQFDRPVFIVASPRSGSTLLFETLSQAKNLWTIGGEAHQIFEYSPALRPGAPGVIGNRITARCATNEVALEIKSLLSRRLVDRSGEKISSTESRIRFLEKTPKNSLRIPFIDKLFPDCFFLYLYRKGRPNISSIMNAWNSGKWVTYRRLPNWPGSWSLLLPPDWQSVIGKPLVEIATFQWLAANNYIIKDLGEIDPGRWAAIEYDSLVSSTTTEIRRICNLFQIEFDGYLEEYTSRPLPPSRYTQTKPGSMKWKQHERDLLAVSDKIDAMESRITCFVSDHEKECSSH